MVTSATRGSRKRPSGVAAPSEPIAPASASRGAGWVLALPLVFAAALASIAWLPSVRSHATEGASIVGAAGFIAAWAALYFYIAGPNRRLLVLTVEVRTQHWLQACAQFTVYLYWGWYWRQVYDSAHLIAAQILFAYGFDMLLGLTRRGKYTLGFGPFPIIFSINLFLWFKPDWFYLQFVMVAVGFLAKEFIRWEKDGKRTHIFNPSSFPLGLFSLCLLLTSNTSMTWGAEIAQTFELPPYVRLVIFCAGLPGQFLFGVTSMTMSAVASVFGFGMVYHALFGTYYFVDGVMPAAVFLGMHLLFTDPSTAPRSELGRIIYGVMYGLAVVALFGVLGKLGLPTFYDKLMAVPVMNLTIQAIDAAVRSRFLHRFDPAQLGATLKPRQRNLAYMAVWAVVFLIVSDPTSSYRPRRWIPLWQQACAEDRRNACGVLSQMETRYCNQGSAWACNELGVLEVTGLGKSAIGASQAFDRACSTGAAAGCANRALVADAIGAQKQSSFQHAQPQQADYPILLQEGQGPLEGLAPAELFERACQQGWADGCSRLAHAYERGDGVAQDTNKSRAYLKKACEGGLKSACSQSAQ